MSRGILLSLSAVMLFNSFVTANPTAEPITRQFNITWSMSRSTSTVSTTSPLKCRLPYLWPENQGITATSPVRVKTLISIISTDGANITSTSTIRPLESQCWELTGNANLWNETTVSLTKQTVLTRKGILGMGGEMKTVEPISSERLFGEKSSPWSLEFGFEAFSVGNNRQSSTIDFQMKSPWARLVVDNVTNGTSFMKGEFEFRIRLQIERFDNMTQTKMSVFYISSSVINVISSDCFLQDSKDPLVDNSPVRLLFESSSYSADQNSTRTAKISLFGATQLQLCEIKVNVPSKIADDVAEANSFSLSISARSTGSINVYEIYAQLHDEPIDESTTRFSPLSVTAFIFINSSLVVAMIIAASVTLICCRHNIKKKVQGNDRKSKQLPPPRPITINGDISNHTSAASDQIGLISHLSSPVTSDPRQSKVSSNSGYLVPATNGNRPCREEDERILSSVSETPISSEPLVLMNDIADRLPYDKKHDLNPAHNWLKNMTEVGVGAFGVVSRGYLITKKEGEKKETKQVVAVKEVRNFGDPAQRRVLECEMNLLSHLSSGKQHPNIVRLIGAFNSPEQFRIVLEYCDGGNLQKFLLDNKPHYVELDHVCAEAIDKKQLTRRRLVTLLQQVAQGMQFIHSKRCVHRDLAARNILLSDHCRLAKITDFGLAKDIYEDGIYESDGHKRIPWPWYAPESLKQGIYVQQSDAWSFGVLLWEVLSFGERPYLGINSGSELLRHLEEGNLLPKPKCADEDLYGAMIVCWQWIPSDRPSFKEINTRLQTWLQRRLNSNDSAPK